jgi:hypothetical protein
LGVLKPVRRPVRLGLPAHRLALQPAEHLGADDLQFLERIGTAVVGLSEENDVTSAYAEYFHAHHIRGLLTRPDFAVIGVARRTDQFAGSCEQHQACCFANCGLTWHPHEENRKYLHTSTIIARMPARGPPDAATGWRKTVAA